MATPRHATLNRTKLNAVWPLCEFPWLHDPALAARLQDRVAAWTPFHRCACGLVAQIGHTVTWPL
jgi:hypothetical protein